MRMSNRRQRPEVGGDYLRKTQAVPGSRGNGSDRLPVSAEIPEITTDVGAIGAEVHSITSNIRPIPRDLCRRAEPQISAKLPSILSQVDPIASDVPETGPHIRARTPTL